MREIKFRAKTVDEGRWVYGFGVMAVEYTDGSVSHHMYTYNGDYHVDPETIGQFTCLKDRTGKNIYEGDILDGCWISPMTGEKVVRYYRVVYEKAVFYAQLIGHHPYGTTLLYFENKKSEVIGNAYDNPELLEESK